MSDDHRGSGFYVDAAGQVRACRTDERVERPSAAVLTNWVVRLEAALQCADIGEGANSLMVQAVRDEIRAWCAPDPRRGLQAIRELAWKTPQESA